MVLTDGGLGLVHDRVKAPADGFVNEPVTFQVSVPQVLLFTFTLPQNWPCEMADWCCEGDMVGVRRVGSPGLEALFRPTLVVVGKPGFIFAAATSV